MLAHTAVLGPRWLEELAGAAVGARVEHGEVKGVLGHLEGVVVARDVARVDGAGEVEEEVGAGYGEGGKGAVKGSEERPGTGQEHEFAAGKENEEENDDGRVAVVEHVVAKALEGTGEAATGDDTVKCQKAGGNGGPNEVV